MLRNILNTIIGFLSLSIAFIMLFDIISNPLRTTNQLTQPKKESNIVSSTKKITNPSSTLTKRFNIPQSTIAKTNSPNSSTIPNTTYPATTANSTINWAGYMATNGQFSGIYASWTVPNVNSNSSNNSGLSADTTWVGIGGVNSNNLFQTGTQDIVNCRGEIRLAG